MKVLQTENRAATKTGGLQDKIIEKIIFWQTLKEM